MNKDIQGSISRDIFKRCHKQINKFCYACDADFILVEKSPEGIVAYLDYKKPNDKVTFSEAIAYNEWVKTKPVYIVEGLNPEAGPFVIKEYLGANWKPYPPIVQWGKSITVANWRDFEKWEVNLRNKYTLSR